MTEEEPVAKPMDHLRPGEHAEPPAYTDVAGVARYCGVSQRTVRRWMKCGLKHYKPAASQQGGVLIKFSDLDAWLEKHAVENA